MTNCGCDLKPCFPDAFLILVSVAVPALGWSTPGVVMIVWLQSRDRHPQLEDGEGGSICKGWEWWGD